MSPIHITLTLLVGSLFLTDGLARTEPPATPQLGRLFLTPEERAALERRRWHTRNPNDDGTRLDGIVLRSSGKTTVWINQRPHTENEVRMHPAWKK